MSTYAENLVAAWNDTTDDEYDNYEEMRDEHQYLPADPDLLNRWCYVFAWSEMDTFTYVAGTYEGLYMAHSVARMDVYSEGERWPHRIIDLADGSVSEIEVEVRFTAFGGAA